MLDALQSRVLYESGSHVVCVGRWGLIVQRKNGCGGERMLPSHPQYADWLDAFTNYDVGENDLLCRAFLRNRALKNGD